MKSYNHIKQSVIHNLRSPNELPIIVAALLLFITLGYPPILSYDEFHYIPAAKEMITLGQMRNYEHPPLAKFIMGFFWLLLHKSSGLLSEVTAMRVPAALAGIGTLLAFRSCLLSVGFPQWLSGLFIWSVILNLAWYVQAKTAMLDIFALFFSLCAVAVALRQRVTLSLILFGLAMATKWSVLPILIVILSIHRRTSLKQLTQGAVAMMAAYYATFFPLVFLTNGAVSFGSIFIKHQLHMLNGLQSTSLQPHSYQSNWWQWLTLHRPIWYIYSKVEGVAFPAHYTVFQTGNPFIFIPGLISIIYLTLLNLRRPKFKIKRDHGLVLGMFYFSMILWVLAPRKLMFFYYVVPASLWFGPAIGLAMIHSLGSHRTRKPLTALIALAALFFVAMAPLAAGIAMPDTIFRSFYQFWMYRINWI
jgi:predicted membrane-bound dolichyl-phosphate-mannose-protein mannosyltransferase